MKSCAFVFVFFITIVLGSISCQKTEKILEADIELISPAENSFIYLPDTLQIEFKLESENPVESIEISIVNSNYISLFGINTVINPQMGEQIKTTMLLDPLKDFDDAPYFIRISSRFPNNKSNSYFRIQLANKTLAYKGFFLFYRPEIHQTKIDFFDQDLNDTVYFSSPGEYLDSEISSFYKRLYLLTEIPAKLKSFSIDEQQVKWEQDPGFPHPKFTEIIINEDRIYAGMESGQIVGYGQLKGQQKVVTETLADSFPEKIHLQEDFIVSNYLSRMNGKRTLITFYKETGIQKHRHPIDFEVVSFIKSEDPEEVMIIGNENQTGIMCFYNSKDNYFEGYHQIEEGEITDVCVMNDGMLFLLIGNNIYLHYYKQNATAELISFQQAPEKIYFEQLTKRVVVQFEMDLSFFLYPEMLEISSLNFSDPLKTVQFYYQYD